MHLFLKKTYKATFVPRLNDFASMFIVVESATHLENKINPL